MRFVPTSIHAGLDYVLGLVLTVFPSVTGPHQGGLIEWEPMLLGKDHLCGRRPCD